MSATRWSVASALFALSVLPSISARAQSEPTADEHIRRGIELRRTHDDGAALDEFRLGYTTWRSPRALAQMALAEQALGRWLDAETHLTEALHSSADPWVGKNASRLEEARAEIEPHLGTIEVLAGIAGAELWLDGARAGTLPAKARVAAGHVTLEVRAPGYIPQTQTVEVAPRETTRVIASLAPVTPAPPPEHAGASTAPALALAPARRPALEATEPTPPRRAARTAAWLTLGGAGLLVGGAAVASVVAEVERSKHNDDPSCTSKTCAVTRSLYNTSVSLEIAGYAAGGAAAALGTWLALSAPASSPASPAARMACVPGILSMQCAIAF